MLIFSLLLICTWGGVISAFAEDFKPASGVKYLIKCKQNGSFAIYNSTCYKGENNNTVVLSRWNQTDERSYFYIEFVSGNEYYIKSATSENVYVYAIDKEANASNIGIKAFENPDETCLWTITYNSGTEGFYIKPKGGSNAWNCYGSYGGNNHISQWGGANDPNSTWYFIPQTIPSGYFTLKNKATDRYTNYFNDFTYASNPNGYTMGSSALPETLSNGYIWHVSSNDKGVLTVTNGQGGLAFKTDNGVSTSTLTVMAYTDGSYAFSPVLNAGNSGRPVGNYQRLTTWSDGGVAHADNLWNFNTIDGFDEANIYNVVVNNAAGYVTYNTTSEAAKNGGFFYLTSTPQTSDFTAATLELYNSSISINDHTITVTYTLNANGLSEKVASVESDVLNKTGVGYPTASSSEHAALAQAIANAKAATADNADALNAALDAAVLAYKTTTNVQMPENGHTYVFTNVHKTQERTYINYKETGLTLESRGTTSADELPQSAKFTCHVVNGRYVFVNNSGKFLIWKGKNKGANNQKGYMDTYDATECNLQFEKITKKDYVNVNTEDLFGYVTVAGNDPTSGKASSFIVTAGSGFNQDNGGLKHYYQDYHSTAFLLEEVTYPNEVTFASTNGQVTGADYVATFSAPFATIIPEGVTAYIVKTEGTTATLTPIEGAQAIPARTGVILSSTDGAAARMVPAADETTAEVTDNELGNSAGVALELTAESGYILGKRDGQIAFYHTAAGTLPMNRAYLRKSTDQSVQSIQMVFTPATSIGEATTTINTVNVPLYDLAGRRVMKPTKGGVYIQNGRKFIVK